MHTDQVYIYTQFQLAHGMKTVNGIKDGLRPLGAKAVRIIETTKEILPHLLNCFPADSEQLTSMPEIKEIVKDWTSIADHRGNRP
ncbi:MAG: hypothetical protein WCG98_03300 [bacterium]